MEGTWQIIHGIDTGLDPDLIYVFVQILEQIGHDDFFVLTQDTLQEIVRNHHSAYLAKHNGIRPQNPSSTHMGLLLQVLEVHRERWEVITSRLFLASYN